MKYINLGHSDLNISRICMGFGNSSTGQHSWTVDENDSRNIIRHALDQGINFFDTSIIYQLRYKRAVPWSCVARHGAT